MPEAVPGRSCPASYRYAPGALAAPAELRADTLWIAGGLYGNVPALECLLEGFAAEPGHKALVFNGDFHWFDMDPLAFSVINETALLFHATRGNVETELATPSGDAGCGCAYPPWVDDHTVERSNGIIERLRATATRYPEALTRLAALPMHLCAQVGDVRVAIVHGDAASLAGWSFSQEALARAEGRAEAEAALARASVDVFASSHTCLPVMQRLANGVIANNGAAGMPNFRGETYGVATRISTTPHKNALYGTFWRGLFIEAVALRYDAKAWQRRFLAQWPEGSHAHRSYWDRIVNGPHYTIGQALRDNRVEFPRGRDSHPGGAPGLQIR